MFIRKIQFFGYLHLISFKYCPSSMECAQKPAQKRAQNAAQKPAQKPAQKRAQKSAYDETSARIEQAFEPVYYNIMTQ